MLRRNVSGRIGSYCQAQYPEGMTVVVKRQKTGALSRKKVISAVRPAVATRPFAQRSNIVVEIKAEVPGSTFSTRIGNTKSIQALIDYLSGLKIGQRKKTVTSCHTLMSY